MKHKHKHSKRNRKTAVPIHRKPEPTPIREVPNPMGGVTKISQAPPPVPFVPFHTSEPTKTITIYSASMRWFDWWGICIRETTATAILPDSARGNLHVKLLEEGWRRNVFRWNVPENARITETTRSA